MGQLQEMRDNIRINMIFKNEVKKKSESRLE